MSDFIIGAVFTFGMFFGFVAGRMSK